MLTLSAGELAERIRRRENSSEEIVRTHIRWIKKVNPSINAVVCDRFQAAMQEARQADEQVRQNGTVSLPSFLGVPCTIKECFAVKGMPNASGVVARRNLISFQDAPVVARLRKAGAIILGVTNTPELCLWIETFNKLYGQTRNPYDLTRVVGGSSGGEGAIIGAGGSPFGIGSDMGGSVRFPAFFNGVYGHKPTGGLVPSTGQFPLPGDSAEVRRIITTGVLCRRAGDLFPLLKIIAGPDEKDRGCRAIDLQDPAQVQLSNLTVYAVFGDGRHFVAEDLLQAEAKVARALEEAGGKIRKTKVPQLKNAMALYIGRLLTTSEASIRDLLQKERFSPLSEFLRWTFRRSPHILPVLLLSLESELPEWLKRKCAQLSESCSDLKKKLTDLLGSQGVMLYPSYRCVAPRHYQTFRFPEALFRQAIFNALEFPVTQVPLGLNAEGLPLGVQVIAAPENDHITIAVAQTLEERLGGWVPPCQKGKKAKG